VDVWITISAFLGGVVITLIGAWATHSVSKEDLMTAIANQNEVYSTQLKSLQELITRLWDKIDEMEKRMAQRRYSDLNKDSD